MGNNSSAPTGGQLSIELILLEDEIYLKLKGSGALNNVTRYFSRRREVEILNFERSGEFIVEHYEFSIDGIVTSDNIIQLDNQEDSDDSNNESEDDNSIENSNYGDSGHDTVN